MMVLFAGFGCMNASEDSLSSALSTMAADAYLAVSSGVTYVNESVKNITFSKIENDGGSDYLLATDNPSYQDNPLKSGVEQAATFCANSCVGKFCKDVKNKVAKTAGVKVEETPSVVQEEGYNKQKIALIGAGAVVVALIAYKVYTYVQCLNVDEQELIDSIVTSASEESSLEAFENIVSWTGVEVVRNAEPVVLTNNQIKAVLKQVARIKSVQSKKLIIAIMLINFDMNEKTRKNVVAKLRSL